MNNRELYDEIFAHVFTVDKSELGEDFVFGKVEKWDSVAHLNLISELKIPLTQCLRQRISFITVPISMD